MREVWGGNLGFGQVESVTDSAVKCRCLGVSKINGPGV